MISSHKIDILISDNRYGLWNKQTFTVFITHQLMVKLPTFIKFFEPLLHRIIKKIIKKYDECWVPDIRSGETLTGDLSHKFPVNGNIHFIGPLSRFRDCEIKDFEGKEINDIFIILSGPEPQRSKLEDILFSQLRESSVTAVVVRGITEKRESFNLNKRVKVYSHLPTPEMFKYFRSSKTIICRSGYSSVMDIVTLGNKAVFIPTPGQTEQEYLAEYLMKKKMFYSVKQRDISIDEALERVKKYSPVTISPVTGLLAERINKL
jgi:UDP:flavonoid glycosyltransferase YjiC (YdhE family)